MAANFCKLMFVSPEVNPANRKAKSIPIFNPVDQYGRVFLFSWLGFMVAFLSWYAFPPLVSQNSDFKTIQITQKLTLCHQLTDTIKGDLHMTQTDVANSNIVALLAT